MDALMLARLQFTVTSVYHFFFVPLTMGMAVIVAIMQTAWVASDNDVFKRMARFWGTLFVINFAMGVVTGIVQEFQFGMNWSEYSRFVGDIFGVPLAIEALMAFFIESTFIGLWIFGWDRLEKRLHLATIWMVAISSNLSALWILVANSWMQEPVGYTIEGGRAVLTDFFALLANPHVWVQFPHVFTAAITTGAFFIIGISAWHLLRQKNDLEMFRRSFQIGVIAAVIGTVGVILVGHTQAQHMIEAQPMKMAAGEALWDTEDPASMSIFTIGNEPERRDVFAIRIPALLSLLAYNRLDGEVQGINELQEQYVQEYGPGNYVPPVAISYWSFRIMVGAGFLMLILAIGLLFYVIQGNFELQTRILWILPFAIALPYLANSAGWIFTEVGRQPWIVFGLMRIEDAVSPNVGIVSLWISLIGFTLVYTGLAIADVYLLARYARNEKYDSPGSDEGAAHDGPMDGLLSGAAPAK
ncbi:MAG: cytochrome ubiquinol oxidase subunit I [Chloroflexi bacterium]|nr:cytochrome ubiquinol oxidase subunit I [Chloroflexota bacterium]